MTGRLLRKARSGHLVNALAGLFHEIWARFITQARPALTDDPAAILAFPA